MRFAFLTLLVVGCSSVPVINRDPIDVSGTVFLPDGRPAKNLTINFFPTSSSQMQGGSALNNGKFSAKLNPGKYTFAFEGNLSSVPVAYHSNSIDHSVDISPETQTLTINLK